MKALSVQDITVDAAQLLPQASTSINRKRTTDNDETEKNICISAVLFSMDVHVKYSTGCSMSLQCRKTYKETVQNTISTVQQGFNLAIPINGGSINVQLTFCSLHSILSGKRYIR